MEFLAKAAYYCACATSGLVITFFFLAGVVGRRTAATNGREVIVTLVAGAVGYGIWWLAARYGHQQQQWVLGLVLAISALGAAAAVMFVGLLVFGKVHWQ